MMEKTNEEMVIQRLQACEAKQSRLISHMRNHLLNPWTTVRASLEIMDDMPELISDLLPQALQDAKTLDRQFDNIFTLAKLEMGQQGVDPSHFDVSALVTEKFAEHDLVIKNELRSVGVLQDKKLLSQVLTNLVSNLVENKKGNWLVSIHSDADTFTLKIENECGVIMNDLKEVISNRFNILDASLGVTHGGVGIGIPVSQAIIELLGGTLKYLFNATSVEAIITLPKELYAVNVDTQSVNS